MPDCTFCKIIEGKIPTVKIYEDSIVLAILDINPASEGHTLILPKKHFENIGEIPNDTLILMIKLSKLLFGIIKKVTKATGMNLYACEGKSAGQRIPHFYINLIPSYDKEPIAAEWPRKQVEDIKQFEELSKKIKEIAEKESKSLVAEEVSKVQEKAMEKMKEEAKKKAEVEKTKEEKENQEIMRIMGKRFP